MSFGVPSEQGNPNAGYTGPESLAPKEAYAAWENENNPEGYEPWSQSQLYNPETTSQFDRNKAMDRDTGNRYGAGQMPAYSVPWTSPSDNLQFPTWEKAKDWAWTNGMEYGGTGVSTWMTGQDPYHQQQDSPRGYLPTLDDLVKSGVLPPRLAAALRPLQPGGPDYNYSLHPQGGYRPLSRQTYNQLNPSDIEALSGTLNFIGNRSQDFLAPYNRPMYSPQIRYGQRARLG